MDGELVAGTEVQGLANRLGDDEAAELIHLYRGCHISHFTIENWQFRDFCCRWGQVGTSVERRVFELRGGQRGRSARAACTLTTACTSVSSSSSPEKHWPRAAVS